MPEKKMAFDKFVQEWARRTLPRVEGPALDEALQQSGQQLTQDALTAGFRAELSGAVKPYRSMAEYVRALHDRDRRRTPTKPKGR